MCLLFFTLTGNAQTVCNKNSILFVNNPYYLILDTLKNEAILEYHETFRHQYFKAIDTKMLNAKLINAAFKEERNGKLKIISFSAKRARGSMADFVIRNNITQITDLQAFNADNYAYNTDLSDEHNLIFTR